MRVCVRPGVCAQVCACMCVRERVRACVHTREGCDICATLGGCGVYASLLQKGHTS